MECLPVYMLGGLPRSQSVQNMSTMGFCRACSSQALWFTVLIHSLLLSLASLSNVVSCNWMDRRDSLISDSGLTYERHHRPSLYASGRYPGRRHSLPHHVEFHDSNMVAATTQTRVNTHVHGLDNFITRPQRILTRGERQKKSKLIADISDRDVLLEFKANVKSYYPLGDEVLLSWNPSKNPDFCSGWQGVRCNRAHRVVALRLAFLSLTGNISPALGNLSFLTTLDLSFNLFIGSLPKELGALVNLEELLVNCNYLNGTLIGIPNSRNLRSLDLSINILIGGIPPHWSNCTNLKFLNLARNRLTGSIPSQFGSLGQLEELSLGDNLLNVSTFTATSNWTGLRHLDLGHSQLTRIEWQVGDWSNLGTLYLSANLLMEVIFTNFTNLRTLYLRDNQLSGPIPSSVGNCTKLQHFDLSNNQLSGPIPSGLLALKESLSIHLGNNFLTGSIPSELGGLASLTTLDISNNPLGGDISPAIANCSNLQYLYLSNTSLSGKLPFNFHELQSLSTLDMSSNHLRGNMSMLLNVTSLKSLLLGSNHFNGPVPTFSNCTNLIYLNLSSNHFHGQIPETLVGLRNLCLLDLSRNQLSGTIPKLDGALKPSSCRVLLEGEIPVWIWSQASILQLDLSDNFLAGNISHIEILSNNFISGSEMVDINTNITIILEDTPTGGMNSLKYQISGPFDTGVPYIDLSNNFLRDEIPPGFGDLQGLIILNLDNNFFSGNIPKSLKNCTSLKFLNAANNILTGNLPFWPLGLMLMDLSSNQLHGPIPRHMSNLTQLVVLRLTNNSLNGSIVCKFDRIQSLVALVLDNNFFSGSIPKSLANCSKLQLVNLNSNNIVGIIPDISNQLGDLRVLDIGLNDMEGEVPTWIWKLEKLQILNLSYNGFHGMIPNDFVVLGGMRDGSSNGISSWTLHESLDITWNGAQLTFKYVRHDLTSLDLSSNNFSGAIPSQFGELKALINLNLSKNLFHNVLSENLGSIIALERLDLSFNHLSGSLPPSLAKLDYLETLELGGNNLSGLIPIGKQFFTFHISSYRPGNLGLCGSPLKSCDTTPIPFFNCTTSRCLHDLETHQDDTSFSNIVSVIALEIGILLGFSLVFCVLVVSHDIRHIFFGFIKLPDRRQFTRTYGLFREYNF